MFLHGKVADLFFFFKRKKVEEEFLSRELLPLINGNEKSGLHVPAMKGLPNREEVLSIRREDAKT